MSHIKIGSSRLEVEISQPGSFYNGSRFDWTGFITEITFDKNHKFCASESRMPGFGSGGRGLCNEFGIHEPIGYDEAKIGELFPKLGVGLLTRDTNDTYNFYKPYKVMPFEFEVESKQDSVTFIAKPRNCNGYEARIKKEISLNENRMQVSYTLENLGTKPIDTTEYLHNFINPDAEGIGPHNRLTFSFKPVGEEMPEVFDVQGNTITWKEVPRREFYWAPKGYEGQSYASWELTNENSGIGMKETTNFPILRVGIWGKAHVVSPELFIKISAKPGETQKWTRSYEFFKK